jgi:hypothetical protein
MPVHQPIASTLCHIDLAWQSQREQFLDSGREPHPLDWQSLALVSAFFALSWGLASWQGMAHLTPAIATATIVNFASLRFSSFNQAYEQYLHRRAEAMLHSSPRAAS